MEESGLIWDDVINPSTGWLVPGRHFAEMDEVRSEFVDGKSDDRRAVWDALQLLLSTLKALLPSGALFVSGTFVSRQPGPVDPPTIAIAPHDESALQAWTDAEEDRFLLHQSLYDVVVGSLGPGYYSVIHPLGGWLEVIYAGADEQEIEELVKILGATTLSSGEDIVGARGVVELEW